MKYFKRIRSENIKLNMCRNRVWHACFILRIKTWKTKTSKLRRKRSTQLLRECWSFLKKLMTCQNLQNNLLNITVLFIWYLLSSLKKMPLVAILASVWKKMVSHTANGLYSCGTIRTNRHGFPNELKRWGVVNQEYYRKDSLSGQKTSGLFKHL